MSNWVKVNLTTGHGFFIDVEDEKERRAFRATKRGVFYSKPEFQIKNEKVASFFIIEGGKFVKPDEFVRTHTKFFEREKAAKKAVTANGEPFQGVMTGGEYVAYVQGKGFFESMGRRGITYTNDINKAFQTNRVAVKDIKETLGKNAVVFKIVE